MFVKLVNDPTDLPRETHGPCGEGGEYSYLFQLSQQYKWVCRDCRSFQRKGREGKHFFNYHSVVLEKRRPVRSEEDGQSSIFPEPA